MGIYRNPKIVIILLNTKCTISFDGVVRNTITPAGGIDFGANVPDTAYIGQKDANERQGDAVFSAPPVMVDISEANLDIWARGVKIYA